jgi:y4mF family transcriptional regulator
MATSPENTPTETLTSTQAVGALLRQRRRALALTQADVARLGHTGQRFIVDLERGKPTVQLHKVLAVLDLLGLALVIQPKPDASAASVS